MRPRTSARALIPGAALGGVVVGHWLAYVAAVPGPDRVSFLASTGHAYWTAAIATAVVFGALSAVRTAVRSFRHGLRREEPTRAQDRFLHLLPTMSLLQVAIFVVQEATERLVARVPLATLSRDHILVVGILVQLAIAALAALVLALLGRVAEAIGRSLAPGVGHSRSESLPHIARGRVAPSVLFRGAHGSRAPPRAAGIAA